MPAVLSVKQLNLYVRSLIEGDSKLNFVSVSGEISNFKNHYSSGHLYFTLKDNDALIRCVMFKSNAIKLKCELYDGLAVICKGRVSLYEKDGQYQFYVEDIVPFGDGALSLEFERIKQKLDKEGLFSASHKKPLPTFPKTVAIVTSGTGAALQDIINILTRRYPLCDVVICPVLVQGNEAPDDIINSLERLYRLNIADVIILGRGGGSVEDLWAFNSEKLAYTVYSSPVPIISAVGHETDFTICDFVADLRAPTPSAAAELAVPDISELKESIQNTRIRIGRLMKMLIENAELYLNRLRDSRYFLNPYLITDERILALDKLSEALSNSVNTVLSNAENRFKLTITKLEALSPLKVMARGYSVVSSEDKVIKSIKNLNNGQDITVSFVDGKATCQVTDIKE